MTATNGDHYTTVGTEQRMPEWAVGYDEDRPYRPEFEVAEPPLGDLFRELTQDVRRLVNLEVNLAKTELSEKAAQAGKSVGFMAAGGFVIYAGFLAIVFALIAGLANFIPLWISALLVGVVVGLIGYALVRKGMEGLKGPNLAPKQTVDSLKDNKEWVQDQVR